MYHEIKCLPVYFEAIVSGAKKFEYRYNDRNYQVDDTLVIREFDVQKYIYTGRKVVARVSYILHCNTFDEGSRDYVIMSLGLPLGLSGVRNQDNLESF